ncbi:hypothetical protein MASR2M12_05310 [Bacteroidales bacterium]
MIRKIVSTSITRILNAFTGLVVLWLATNFLGSREWGVAGLVMLDVSLILLAADMAGNALVFYSSRRQLKKLMFLAIGWLSFIVLIAGAGMLLLKLKPQLLQILVPEGYELFILILVILSGLHGINQNILLGRQQIRKFNILFSLQFLLVIPLMTFFIWGVGVRTAWAVVWTQTISYAVSVVFGFLFLIQLPKTSELRVPSLREMLNFGLMTQLSSITHLLNKRLGFYFIRSLSGLANLGVYHSATQLTEGLRLIGQSISLVQLSAISNSNNADYAKEVTIRLMKLAVMITLLAVIVLCLIPSVWFGALLGKDFGSVNTVIFVLSPGVVALAANSIFSHFFSGTGRPRHNLYASVTGLCISLPSVILLVKPFGMLGAAASASLAYIAAVAYQWVIFRKITGARYSDFVIRLDDIRLIKEMLGKFLTKKQATS